MLSKSAFNALLKTLEEPPAHVKFVFATTEIRKVPVTVLSRCQRFDLRRIEPEEMMAMLRQIADAEKGAITDAALALLVRASEGSARDAQSLLDQSLSQGVGETDAEAVRAMLGLADRGRVLDLFDLVLKGDAAGALAELSAQYADGADPIAVLRDLAEVCHWVSVIKITPEAADDPTVPPDERDRGRTMADALAMPILARFWQMLLKALEEVAQSPNAMMAAEMAIIRLTHVADLPTPGDLVRQLRDAPPPSAPGPKPGSGAASQTGPVAHAPARAPSEPPAGAGPVAAVQRAPEVALAHYASFDHVLDLIRSNRDALLEIEVKKTLRLVRYMPGRIEFEPTPDAEPDLAQRLAARLQRWTGNRWAVSVVSEGGAPTFDEAQEAGRTALEAEARDHPLVQTVFEHFPDARITDIRTTEQIAAEAAIEALPEVDDEWDPFEEE